MFIQRVSVLLTAVCILAAATAQAQVPAGTRITGVVLESGATPGAIGGISGATIQLAGTSDSTVSDDDGHFSLRQVPAGQYTITVRRIGFLPYQHPLLVSQRPVNLTIYLVPQRADTLTRTPVQMQAITITAAP